MVTKKIIVPENDQILVFYQKCACQAQLFFGKGVKYHFLVKHDFRITLFKPLVHIMYVIVSALLCH